jgi:hypothetical protein
MVASVLSNPKFAPSLHPELLRISGSAHWCLACQRDPAPHLRPLDQVFSPD